VIPLLLLTRKLIDCLILKQAELEKNTFPSSKLLSDLVCSLALRLMIQFVLSRWPAATTVNVLPRHFTAPPLGLIDLARSSSAPLLLSVSVGRHNAPPRSSLAPPSSAPLLVSPSVGRHNTPPRSPWHHLPRHLCSCLHQLAATMRPSVPHFGANSSWRYLLHIPTSPSGAPLLSSTGVLPTISTDVGFWIQMQIFTRKRKNG
jgi:hypothetical protein